MAWHAISLVRPVLGGLCRPLLYRRKKRDCCLHLLHTPGKALALSFWISKILWVFILRSSKSTS